MIYTDQMQDNNTTIQQHHQQQKQQQEQQQKYNNKNNMKIYIYIVYSTEHRTHNNIVYVVGKSKTYGRTQ